MKLLFLNNLPNTLLQSLTDEMFIVKALVESIHHTGTDFASHVLEVTVKSTLLSDQIALTLVSGKGFHLTGVGRLTLKRSGIFIL